MVIFSLIVRTKSSTSPGFSGVGKEVFVTPISSVFINFNTSLTAKSIFVTIINWL